MTPRIHIHYTLVLLVLFPPLLFSGTGEEQERDSVFAFVRSDPCLSGEIGRDTVETPLAVTGFQYEIACGYFDGFGAMGAGVTLQLFEPLSIGARASVDFRDGSVFVAPFIGCSWSFGGFEIGNLFRPSNAEWKIPYYESWRIWAGNIDVLYLSVGVLSGIPLASVGYYEAGIGLVIGETGHRVWVGAASTSLRKKAVGGPGLKTEWRLEERTWLTVNGSYLFSHETDEIRYTISAGVKQVF